MSYERKHIENIDDAKYMFECFKVDAPTVMAFDTETTGLHIIYDKPFLIQLGWFNRIFTFYPTQKNMEVFFWMAKRVKWFIGHNVKFDLHMLMNLGYKEQTEKLNNVYDTMHIARLSVEAKPTREGGDSLKLKELGATYISPKAKESEQKINDELEKIRKNNVKVLTSVLKQFDHPTETETKPFRKDTGKKTTSTFAKNKPDEVEWKTIPKKWTKKHIEDFIKDPTNEVTDLPQDVQEVWLDWKEEYPEPTYEDVDRDIMIRYGADDIILTLELFKKFMPIVSERKQEEILDLEHQCILPILRMERQGLKVDREYLEQSRIKVKNYIKELREEMYGIMGERITVGQHIKIRQFFNDAYGIMLDNAQSDTFKGIEKVEHFPNDAKRLAKIIRKLRSLEKWYSTYIKRIQQSSSHDGKAYTQINTAGAVSGRMSSDLQQNPKKPLETLEEEELFHPRKAFVVKGGSFNEMILIDYDQIELVTQAHYTLLVSGGDLNLCRAYMPFHCHAYDLNQEGYNMKAKRIDFDYRNIPSNWKDLKWFLNESKLEEWSPTDVHAETAHNTLILLGYECLDRYKHYKFVPSKEMIKKHYSGHSGEGSFDYVEIAEKESPFGAEINAEQFTQIRGDLGKPANFSKNYGVGITGIVNNLGVSYPVAEALYNGYDESFPEVITYQGEIQHQHAQKGYVRNHYGRRYYLKDNGDAYKLANYVIQGTCADALKKAIIELDKFLSNHRTNLVLPVHDEIIYDKHVSEDGIEQELKEIMQDAFDWCLVPVSAGIERTNTNWKEKSA